MFCNKCGNQIDETAKFCGNCGANLIKDLTNGKNLNKDMKKMPKEFSERIEKIKEFLSQRDGKIHVLIINTLDESRMKDKGYNRATIYVDNAIGKIQEEGYEIIDIKLTATRTYGIIVLITYK